MRYILFQLGLVESVTFEEQNFTLRRSKKWGMMVIILVLPVGLVFGRPELAHLPLALQFTLFMLGMFFILSLPIGHSIITGTGSKGKMIREYDLGDQQDVMSVWHKAFDPAHPFLEKDYKLQLERDTRGLYLESSKIWVAEEEGKIIGFISLKKASGEVKYEVSGFAVASKYQGKGIGRLLMDKAFVEIGAEMSDEKGRLKVEVFKKNIRGCDFYKRYGFTLTEEYFCKDSDQMVLRVMYRSRA